MRERGGKREQPQAEADRGARADKRRASGRLRRSGESGEDVVAVGCA